MNHLPFEKAGFRKMSPDCLSSKTQKISKEDRSDLIDRDGLHGQV